ncbi:sulfite exporter TauE/SafE family protein [Halomonas sp. M1]|uniref:sulfite exporter TauE/SafE family protein n=1 Tax=Roseinatronobacter sp. S2 TaxID=3035471 RepID=UPI0024105F16|nr:sulfite exporter TauE/SafE family protein [Roseinatronobacter sp. S2]
MSDPALFTLTCATFLLAGIVKGVTGMGLPSVAMGLLGALISPLTAANLLIVPSFVTNLWQLLAGPDVWALIRRLWPMMLAICAGTFMGASWLVSGDTELTTAALGGALVIYASYTLFARQLQVPARLESWLSPLCLIFRRSTCPAMIWCRPLAFPSLPLPSRWQSGSARRAHSRPEV